jgi:hypothetical protein
MNEDKHGLATPFIKMGFGGFSVNPNAQKIHCSLYNTKQHIYFFPLALALLFEAAGAGALPLLLDAAADVLLATLEARELAAVVALLPAADLMLSRALFCQFCVSRDFRQTYGCN